jgi:hypothetical protein
LPQDRSYYILFVTIHDVLKAEKVLKGRSLDVEVVPVPRSLSSDCGVCIRSTAPEGTLMALLGDVSGLTYFVFDGVEYKPGGSHKKG